MADINNKLYVSRNFKKSIFVSIVFSFYNEEKVLKELISRTVNVLDHRKDISGYELIFINDDSNDKSEEILKKEIKKDKNIVLVNTTRNFGAPECIYAGFSVAQGDAVINMDADLQDPPEVIHKMIDSFQADKHVHVVHTTRLKRHGENFLKLFITKIGYKFMNVINDIKLPENTGDFKLYSKEMIQLLLRYEEKTPFLRGMVGYFGLKQSQVFYDRNARFDGSENTKRKVLSKVNLYYWLDNAFISFSDAPLKISLIIGFFTAAISILYLGIIIIQKFLGLNLPGWTAIMATVLFLGSIQFILFGFLGLYVKAIFIQVKGRPNYIIKEILSNKKIKK
jgi:dolichol-phosphate mannosyltransferase